MHRSTSYAIEIKQEKAAIGYHWTELFTVATVVGCDYEVCCYDNDLATWQAAMNSLHKSYGYTAINNQQMDAIIPK